MTIIRSISLAEVRKNINTCRIPWVHAVVLQMGRKTGKLFEKGGDSDDDGGLKINKNYADRYDRWREKEEYEKRMYQI